MVDISHSLACLDSRIKKLENQILDYHKHEFKDEPKGIIETVVPPLLERRINDGIELLIKELEEKANNIQVLTDEINSLNVEDGDNITVATEEALNDIGCIEELENDTVIKIHHDCKECIKKKVKTSKILKNKKKKEAIINKKRMMEQQLKIIEEEQRAISLKLMRFD